MRKFNSYLYVTVVALLFGFNSCKSVKNNEINLINPLPKDFAGRRDSASIATIRWNEYFLDKKLIGLVDSALKNNWDIQSALQRIEMSQSDVLLNRGLLRPEMKAVVSAAQRKYGLYTMDGAGNITTFIKDEEIVPIHLQDYFPSLQASWEVDVWGKLRNRKNAALHRYLASMEGKNFLITNLIAEIATSYYQLVALDYELSILDQTISLQENAFELVKVQKDAGVVNALAVNQFEAQLLNSRGMKLEVQQQIIEQENQINFLLGGYPKPVERDSAFMSQMIPAQLNVGLPANMLLQRPDVRQAEFELMASRADVSAARAAFYPALNVNGYLGFQAYTPELLIKTPESYVYGLIGSLTAPLINRSTIRANFKLANARQMDAFYNYQKVVANGYREVYNQVTGIKNLQQIFITKLNEVDALNQAIETSNELFRTGRANYIEVIVAQQNALQAKLELVDVKRRQLNSTVNLYRALGGGWK